MKKLIILFLSLFFIFTSHSQPANALVDGGKCISCPNISSKPNYAGLPIKGNGFIRYTDGSSYLLHPSNLNPNELNSTYYCEYTKSGETTILAKHKEQDQCTGTLTCSDTDGCTGTDTNPNLCTTTNQRCRINSFCQKGSECSTQYCVSDADPNVLCSNKDGGACSCQPRADEPPPCPENADCKGNCSSDQECGENQFCVPDEKGIRTCIASETSFTALACTRAHAGTLDFECKTALGTITASPEAFIRTALAFFLGISGGILLLLLIINGYKLMISQGDPEKIKDAREGIIAAISGLLLIIFSLSVLALITSTILDIPGF